MEVVAHGLWAAAAAVAANRLAPVRLRAGWTVCWAVFPDVLAFGPSIALGVWLRLTSGLPDPGAAHGRLLPHVHIGLSLYPAVHSLVVFAVFWALMAVLARRPVYEMLGWLLHILIDIPTHSRRYYATRFLWPVSGISIDGIAWWTPWFWAATYAALAAVYLLIWKKGWLSRPGVHASRKLFSSSAQ